jgi:hypothetical protein
MIVTIRAPTKGNRNAFEAEVEVENDMVIKATHGLGFMLGWRSQTVREFCRSQGWAASKSLKKN